MIDPPSRPAPQDGRHRPIIVVLHQEHSSPGRVGILLKEMGFPLDIRRPRFGDPLPESLDDHAGAVIFGGPMSANDDEEFLRFETDWIGVPLREKRPFLGLCLGAQMLVNHLGGKVHSHPEGYAEYGWYDLEPTETGEAFIDSWPRKVLQFHKEGVALPGGVKLLARGEERFPNQAFVTGGNAVGVQFHPELTALMLHRWVVRAHERFDLPGAQSARESLQGRLVFDAPLRRWIIGLLEQLFLQPERHAGSERPLP